ncbi:alpha/beta fold hydrolase [Shewanella putrefaciens]|uniref:Alpha/beta hydrolase n=1 Tax=Shewanella putrefaciens TaxID=24 RepID=A0ABX8X8P0_SHEPU|nr:alpha/beta hydrolase [Shewanella putrefaciens]QSE48493.1 alpha/beta hydrolase [Shewanella putrefaciens]QYX71899.1 alpha/beta hydrolase [Shewanella putrefaciens]SUI88256.1 Alpha/beta hydrolase family [Shewanella putrefaciens]
MTPFIASGTSAISQTSLYIPYRDGQLHLRQLLPAKPHFSKTPILMLHGAMSNGRVFYSQSGRGLGCFLARAGFIVYVLDTAGRGLSVPKITRGFTLGQGEVIREQIPLVQQFILNLHQKACHDLAVTAPSQVHWCAHSWGGVLMASSLARYPELQQNVRSLLTFGSKRTIRVKSFKKWLMVDVFWNRLAPSLAMGQGYLAADKLRVGMDNESRASLVQSIDWVRGEWCDHDDGFDYAKAAANTQWPPAWFIAGQNDTVLGHPEDVADMITECGFKRVKFTLLSKINGFKQDYGHGDMLTHLDAVSDHFPLIRDWYLAFDLCVLKD